MRLFVTGGTGFIGAAFVLLAVEAGHDVTVLARGEIPWRLQSVLGRIRLVRGTLRDQETIVRAMDEVSPDGVVHLGWSGVSGKERNDPAQVDNIGWSVRLLGSASAAGARFFVSTGSQAEYGPKGGVISPSAETNPTTLYGECKLATYRVLAKLTELSHVRLVWIRVFSTYGPGDHPYWMIPGLIRALLKGEKPSLTLGEQKWDFLHVTDAARAILAACETEGAQGIFNLGSGLAPPLRDTVQMIRNLVDPRLPLGLGEVPYLQDQVMHLEADTARLVNELGWRPRVPLADGLAETVRWYRANPWIFEA